MSNYYAIELEHDGTSTSMLMDCNGYIIYYPTYMLAQLHIDQQPLPNGNVKSWHVTSVSDDH